MVKRVDIVGKKYDKLTVLKLDHKKGKYSFFLCRCDCGKELIRRRDSITRAGNKSCGCDISERLQQTWDSIKEKKEREGEIIEPDQLFDTDPYEAKQLIKSFCKVDYKKADLIYTDWRKRYRKDKQAFISKVNN